MAKDIKSNIDININTNAKQAKEDLSIINELVNNLLNEASKIGAKGAWENLNKTVATFKDLKNEVMYAENTSIDTKLLVESVSKIKSAFDGLATTNDIINSISKTLNGLFSNLGSYNVESIDALVSGIKNIKDAFNSGNYNIDDISNSISNLISNLNSSDAVKNNIGESLKLFADTLNNIKQVSGISTSTKELDSIISDSNADQRADRLKVMGDMLNGLISKGSDIQEVTKDIEALMNSFNTFAINNSINHMFDTTDFQTTSKALGDIINLFESLDDKSKSDNLSTFIKTITDMFNLINSGQTTVDNASTTISDYAARLNDLAASDAIKELKSFIEYLNTSFKSFKQMSEIQDVVDTFNKIIETTQDFGLHIKSMGDATRSLDKLVYSAGSAERLEGVNFDSLAKSVENIAVAFNKTELTSEGFDNTYKILNELFSLINSLNY